MIFGIAMAFLCTGCGMFGKSTPAEPARPMVTQSPDISPALDLGARLGGEWVISEVGGQAINVEEDVPYINFVPKDSNFYASNGCNILNGSFMVNDGKLTFNNVMSTMKYCAGVTFDADINNVLSDGKTVDVTFEKIGDETYVRFKDARGRLVMSLRRHALDFLNGKWQVIEINNSPIDDEECNIFFDIDELKVHGNTGCNFFNGAIYIDPNAANAISFSEMGVTKRMCLKAEQQLKMLVALEETTSVINGNDGTAILTDGNGTSVIKIKRVPVTGNDNEE